MSLLARGLSKENVPLDANLAEFEYEAIFQSKLYPSPTVQESDHFGVETCGSNPTLADEIRDESMALGARTDA